MKLYFDNQSLINRDKTEIKDEKGNVLYWGIYDFSFKHRTRIFDANDNEVVYVQKDISKEDNVVNFCDNQDKYLGGIVNNVVNPQGWIINNKSIDNVMHISDGCIEIVNEDDLLSCICVLFALIEGER